MRPASLREQPRVVYPYSVLRGGVWSRGELAGRLTSDAVAEAHYRGFRTTEARVERLSCAQRAYISYRVNDAVYWTRAPVVVPAGEAVLTDGENVARARCGNRLSTQPRLPVGMEVDLDTPEAPPPGRDSFFDRPLLVYDPFSPMVMEGSESMAAVANMRGRAFTGEWADQAPSPIALRPSLPFWPPVTRPLVVSPPGPRPADSPEPSTALLLLGAATLGLAVRYAMR